MAARLAGTSAERIDNHQSRSALQTACQPAHIIIAHLRDKDSITLLLFRDTLRFKSCDSDQRTSALRCAFHLTWVLLQNHN